LSLVKELHLLGPCGEGNPAPVFVLRKVKLQDVRKVGKEGRHFKAQAGDLEVIGFSLGDLADKLDYNKGYDLAFRLESNEWNGFDRIQLNLVDVKEAQ